MITSLNVGNQLSATLSRKTEKRAVVIPQFCYLVVAMRS